MKRKTRITAIIAAAAVASALAGCGSSTGTAGTSSSQQASSAPEETQTGETSASADSAASGNADSSSAPSDTASDTSAEASDGASITASDGTTIVAYQGPAWHIDRVYDNVAEGDKDYVAPATIYYPVISLGRIENGCFTADASSIPTASGTQDLSALQNSLNSLSDSLHESDRSTAAIKADGSFYEEDGMSYLAESDAQITRFDGDYFGVQVTTVSFTGGAHGYTMHAGYNYNTKTGKEVFISDVLNDPDSFPQTLADAFSKKYPDAASGVIVDDVAGTFRQEMAEDDGVPLQWNFTNDGIRIYINAYDITAYAAGSFTIDFSTDEYPDLIKSEYTAALSDSESFFEPVEYGSINSPVDNTVTLSDGSTKTLRINYGDEMYDFYSKDSVPVTLEWGSAKLDLGDLSGTSGCSAFVAHLGSRLFLYLDFSEGQDQYSLSIYELGDEIKDVKADSPTVMNETDALYGDAPSSPEYFRVTSPCSLLGTSLAYRFVTMNEDGSYSPVERYYTFEASDTGAVTLTAKTDIAAKVLSGDDVCFGCEAAKVLSGDADEEGTDGTIPSGTKLSLYRTDLKSIVDLKAEDGTLYRVTVESDGSTSTIAGTDVHSLFDEITDSGAGGNSES